MKKSNSNKDKTQINLTKFYFILRTMNNIRESNLTNQNSIKTEAFSSKTGL